VADQCKVFDQCPLRGVHLDRATPSHCFWHCGVRPDPGPQASEGRLVQDVEYEDVRFEYDPFDDRVKN
jgi:hypothetical protein